MNYRELIITNKEAGRRLDVLLSKRFARFSRSQISKEIEQGNIFSTSRPIKPSTCVMLGECIRMIVPELVPSTPPPPLPEIIYEDDLILLVNKPAGMLVHPTGDFFVWALIGLFKTAYPNHRVDLVHRLDRETSGALLLTKNVEANSFLKKQIIQHRVQKIYLAVVMGIPEWEEIDVKEPIDVIPNSSLRLRRGIVEGGSFCHTKFVVEKRIKNKYSLIRCHLYTGRTHQIRVHLEHLGHPILGDKIYGHSNDFYIEYLQKGLSMKMVQEWVFHRQALHACDIFFPHPKGGHKRIKVPLPEEIQKVVDGYEPSWDFNHCPLESE
jgi:23S rRNA pseudouridine1911/1915/1917 synthase